MDDIPTDFDFELKRGSNGEREPRHAGRAPKRGESRDDRAPFDPSVDYADEAGNGRSGRSAQGNGRSRRGARGRKGRRRSGDGRLRALDVPSNGEPQSRPIPPAPAEQWLDDEDTWQTPQEAADGGNGRSAAPPARSRRSRRRAGRGGNGRAADRESLAEEIGLPSFRQLRSSLQGLRNRLPEVGSAGSRGGPPDLGRALRDRLGREPRPPRPGRIKKIRLALILVGIGLLAMISTLFGMMMSVSQDLPQLEEKEQYAKAKNSVVTDIDGEKIGTLLPNDQRILVDSTDITPMMKEAVVAIEDQRFYEHRGVDYVGIARAALADAIPGGTTQGASTITMQFVKNALAAQSSRTVFQKFREAALASHIEREWDKDKILTQYLNTIYFGEGAYGIEAAARTYFRHDHPECGTDSEPCASVLTPPEAALLAGIISSPSAYSPRTAPEAAVERRNYVLEKMREQGVLSELDYQNATETALPEASEIDKPAEDSLAPYFTSWLRQQVVDRYGSGRAFGGGLQVETTLDLDLQLEAEEVATSTLSGVEPTAAVVILDNKTGGVRAMVGGPDFEEQPFNLATNGHRQPGSAMKPFILATALEQGRSPSEVFASQPKVFPVPGSKQERFPVHNYEDQYLGSASIATATQYSDNSVYAELGLQLGTKKIAKTAEAMGIETNVSTNPSMTLGAIDPGVTPLEMAYAYNTLATGGKRVSGNLASYEGGPVALETIKDDGGEVLAENRAQEEEVLSQETADAEVSILETVISGGTGENASTGGFDWGKTGTTENNGDAWFCGGTEHYTGCVWVGHHDSNTPMETDYSGGPVDGGTFPAAIWSQVMTAAETMFEEREAEAEARKEADDDEEDGDEESTEEPTYVPPPSSDYSTGSSGSSGSSGSGSSGSSSPSTPSPSRQPQPAPTPATPAPAPAPGGGGGGGGATGGTGGTGL